MENLSPDTIANLRSLFGQMNNSRRHLRPILSDIANSIDKGFFIDADSDEVHQLLKQILEIQQKLSSVEQLKKSVNLRQIEAVDKSIALLEQNSKRDEINATLARIETLVVDSDDPAIINAVKKVKLQAEHIRNKSGKMNSEQFAQLAERFIILADTIDNADDFSSSDYLKIATNFQDNPLIAMVLTSRIVHFQKTEEIIEEPPKVETPAEKTDLLVPSKHRLSALLIKFEKIKPDLALVLTDSENFSVQKSSAKKNLSIKSFNNKIREMFDSVDPLPIFKSLIKTRIFFSHDPKEIIVHGKITKRIVALVPRLLEKLFDWGIVDKITWREREFFYLNDFGLEICVRNFTHTTAPAPSNNYFESMISALQFAIMFVAEPRIRGKMHFNLTYHPIAPAGRAVLNDGGIIWMFSLILLGEGWTVDFSRFKILVENEMDSVRAIFLFAFKAEDFKWLTLFDSMKIKKIPLFIFTFDGLFDREQNEVNLDSWCKENIPLPSFFDTPTTSIPKPIYKNPPILNAPKAEELQKKVEELPKNDENIFTQKIEQTETVETPVFVEDTIKGEEPVTVENTGKTEAPVITQETVRFDIEKRAFITTVETISGGISGISDGEKTSEDDLVKVDILTGVTNLFKAGNIARGMLALHALNDYFSDDAEIWADNLTKEIGFILDDPITKSALHNFDTFTFWTAGTEIPKANIGTTFDFLNLAATIKNFFAPANPTSYQLQKLWNQINNDKSNTALKSCPAAKTLISLFNNFTDKTHRSFAESVGEVGNSAEDNFKAAIAQIKTVENVADSLLHSDVNHRRVKDLIQQLFKNNGLARKFLYVENFSDDEILDFCQQFAEINLREVLNDNNAEITEETFAEDKISDFLDDVWVKPSMQLARREHEPFVGPKRKKVTGVMTQISMALLKYLHTKKILQLSGNVKHAPAPVDKALEHLADLKKQITRIEKRGNLGIYVFRAFVENLSARLNGKFVIFNYNDCLLGANYIELQNNFPVVNSFGVEEFSLKNRFFDFESDVKDKTFDENLRRAYDTALKTYDCGILQSLTQNFKLGIGEDELKRKISGVERQVEKEIERIYNDFLNDLELARNYSRITDQEKIDSYINAIVAAKNHFTETKNAGLFQRFVDACNESINKTSLPHRNSLNKRLAALEENLEKNLVEGETLEARYPILSNIRHQIELMNLTVAEDYMNRLENEGGNLLTELDLADSNLITLEDFLAEYEILLRAIQSTHSVEAAYKQRMHIFNTSRANRETQNALEFVRGWKEINSGQNPAIESAIIVILEHLGYSGAKIIARNANEMNQKSFTIAFSEQVKIRDSYPHPFAIFGTEIFSKGLEIIYLNTNRNFDNIAQVLSTMTTSRGTIVLFNNPMTLPQRRALAKTMKINANLKNIIVIDQVLALYLTRFDDAQRGKKMLQAALPFARVQPYTQGGVIAPEMFIGRSEELDQIRDMTGPVFVYGGRQLGKSALLRQVRSLENNPGQLNYAFFIDLKNLDSEQTLQKIVYELQTAKLVGEIETWQEFSLAMHKLFDGQIHGVFAPKKLLLLLDESDAFLSSRNSEKAIDILRELLVAFSGRFKFVLAGLHKVIRFEQNSSFGNLNHISVLPFKPSDAMELLVKPMSYLGFRVASDSLLSAIFSRTNYYPGSIQYYCKMLVDAVADNYLKQNFDVSKNPPYTLDDDYLKNMLGNRDFQAEIDQKFQITLHLDDDNYYEILALAVAWIYYEHNRPVSVDVTEIRNICLMCGVDKITKLSDAELLSLLDEMVALNLLRRTDGKFEFNRYAFWHMMGTESEVNDKLDSYGLNA